MHARDVVDLLVGYMDAEGYEELAYNLCDVFGMCMDEMEKGKDLKASVQRHRDGSFTLKVPNGQTFRVTVTETSKR